MQIVKYSLFKVLNIDGETEETCFISFYDLCL